MEESDLELIHRIMPQNDELRALIAEHEEFEKQLRAMDGRGYLSVEEQIERKRIQKLKLAGKDRIEKILSQHRS